MATYSIDERATLCANIVSSANVTQSEANQEQISWMEHDVQKPKSLQSSQDVVFPGDEEEAEDYCDCIGNYNLRNRRANTIDSSTSGIAQWPTESLVPIVSGSWNALPLC